MLDEKERARIREEEIFRSEVRKELSPKAFSPSRRERIWAFLNSTFGFWLLSSIVVGALTWGVTTYLERREIRKTTQERIRRLDLEISNRLDLVQLQARAVTDEKFALDMGRRLVNPPGPNNAIQPEFANWNLKSLVIELSMLLPEGSSEKKNLSQALSLVDTLWTPCGAVMEKSM